MRTLAAVGGVCLIAVALVVAVLTLHGSATAGAGMAPPSSAASPLTVAAPDPSASGAGRGTEARGESPFGTAGTYLRGRSGTVTAAVYDLRTGQEWTLGGARPQ